MCKSIKTIFRAESVAQVVKHQPSKGEALSSNCSTIKKKKKRNAEKV
jgi:hypothetical protein